MSDTYNITCHDCGDMLWMGQCPAGRNLDRAWLYTSANDHKLQREFFYRHIGHRLEFNRSEYFDATYAYKEIEREPF